MGFKKFCSFTIIGVLILALFNSADAVSLGIKKQSNSSVTIKNSTTVNNYTEFYNALKSAVKVRKSNITIYAKNYTKSKYDSNKAIKQLNSEKSGRNYYISSSSIQMKWLSNSKDRTLYVQLQYKSIEKIANPPKTKGTDIGISNNSYSDIYNAIKDAVGKANNTIDLKVEIPEVKNDFNKLSSVIENDINKVNEDSFGMSYVNSWEILYSGNGSTKITFKYYIPGSDIIKRENELNEKAGNIIAAIIKPGMSDFEKEITIHNYIINNTDYDEENLNKGTVPRDSFTAYGVLVKGVGVCEGYSYAMCKLLNLAGVEAMVISGDSASGGTTSPHMWNLVKLDGAYYHVDSTWDDPIYTLNGVRKDVLKFNYFNLTDSQISKDHAWDTNKYPKCNSTKYKYTDK